MNPDQDRYSKHGTFNHSPHTITSPSSSTTTYIPNPARTIVMEQLPKTSRTQDFIKSWSKSACGAHPVYFAVDPPSAKALIEFATAELARKAWGSPKLGSGVSGPPLKGKPRADLIRVWWYRVDGVGAGAGVGEIEEGEIEGDAAEREVSVPLETTKKETKKERKARLAREREAKMGKTQLEMSPSPVDIPPETAAIAPFPNFQLVPSDPPQAPEAYTAVTPNWAPDYPPPPAYGYRDHNAVYRSQPGPPDYPAPPPPTRPPPLRSPLPPQAALGAQWQPRYPQADWSENGANRGVPPDSLASSASFAPDPIRPPPPPAIYIDQSDADAEMELETPSDIAPASSEMLIDAPPPLQQPPPAWASLLTSTSTPPPSLPPSSSVSPRSSDLQSTPPLEPRAMKNAPKGPSFTKRTLVARHKDLEERIARGKMELGLKSLGAETTPSPTPPTLEVPPPAPADTAETSALMEDNLRRLVLKSQKTKARAVATASSNGASSVPPAPAPSSQTVTAAASGGFSFDDLAVSFITETIQTLQPGSLALAPPPPPPLPPKPVSATQTNNNASLKQQLAAKQARLEQHIAESKTLMAQLTAARTKQEKDRLLVVMRERSRMMEEETAQDAQSRPAADGAATPPKQAVEPPPPPPPPVVKLPRWPESRNDVCVLIISDDEEEEEESEEEDV
ncbi:hypothetical protein C8J57DRAFT_1365349 [Mycena rebaudengoi]|nr:hypothetical protein C8J57DRAFT_1365349 [Mycena rebaudengoi]